MKKNIIILMVLLISLTLFAQTGRVVVNITYTVDGSTVTKQIVSYYNDQASTLGNSQSRLRDIITQRRIQGENITDLKSASLVDENGRITTTLTYQQEDGSNKTLTIQDFYDTKEAAYNSVMTQVSTISRDSILNGDIVNDLVIGPIEEMNGSYVSVLNYRDNDGTARQFTVKKFFDKKEAAYSSVMSQVKTLQRDKILYGDLATNVTVSDIQEVDGRFMAILNYKFEDGTTKNQTVQEFFDQKTEAYETVMTKLQHIDRDGIINGDIIDKLAISEIEENNGKVMAVLDYTVADGTSRKYVIQEFFDPKEQAISEIMAKVQVLERDLIYNGDSITDLVIGEIEIF
jgi:hypothetical protein